MPRVSEEHLEAKRARILYAAIACFARDGFHKTTMTDIAEMAGVSDGLAYRYFSGKDEIIREAVQLATSSGGPPDVEPVDADDAESMLRLIYRSSFDRFQIPDRWTTVGLRVRSWAEALESDDVRGQVVARWERYGPIAEGLWAKAQEQGSVPADLDPSAVARVLLAVHDGLDLQWALDPSLEVDQCREVLMALIGGGFSVGRADSSDAA